MGRCHVKPPTTDEEGHGTWPLVNAYDFCSEFKLRPPEQEEKEED